VRTCGDFGSAEETNLAPGYDPSGGVEGLNNKAKVTMRESYGFRACRILELALYDALGKTARAESSHGFF
jgi:hypothetical protein